MSMVRISFIALLFLMFWQFVASASENGTMSPEMTLVERASDESVTFHSVRQSDLAIVYVDYFNGGEPVDLDILEKVSGRSIFSDRPDGPKITVFAIGSMNSYPDENRFPVYIDDSFSAPDLLGIDLYPYVLTVDCQGNIIGQMHFEPPSQPGDPLQTSGLLESGKWSFIQESIQRAVKSGACK